MAKESELDQVPPVVREAWAAGPSRRPADDWVRAAWTALHDDGYAAATVAVDSSAVGRRKALDLAARRGVTLEYRLADVAEDLGV